MTISVHRTAVILCAGQGTRIRSVTDRPKCLLDIHGESILRRQIQALRGVGVERTIVILGFSSELIVSHLEEENLLSYCEICSNDEYLVKGNSYSMTLGLERCPDGALILDGDLVFDPANLDHLLAEPQSAFLVGRGDPLDEECAKTYTDPSNCVRLLIDKRLPDGNETVGLNFAGEAIGIISLDKGDRTALLTFARDYLANSARWQDNWEKLFSAFLQTQEMITVPCVNNAWIEVDTKEDYDRALELFLP